MNSHVSELLGTHALRAILCYFELAHVSELLRAHALRAILCYFELARVSKVLRARALRAIFCATLSSRVAGYLIYYEPVWRLGEGEAGKLRLVHGRPEKDVTGDLRQSLPPSQCILLSEETRTMFHPRLASALSSSSARVTVSSIAVVAADFGRSRGAEEQRSRGAED